MIDKIIADGGDGLDVLIYCLKHEPFIQGIILFGLFLALFSWYYDNKVDDKADWSNNDHL